jgi:hydroxypyruvate isomerase
LRAAAALAAAGAAGGLPPLARGEGADQAESAAAVGGRLQQSVCRWCYAKIPLDDLCAAARRMGLVGIDLLKPGDFPTLKRFGLACTMTSSHPLANGLCDPKFHGACLEAIHAAIEATAKEGWNTACPGRGGYFRSNHHPCRQPSRGRGTFIANYRGGILTHSFQYRNAVFLPSNPS